MRHTRLAAFAGVLLSGVLLAAAAPKAEGGGALRILLTNDDGYDAPGIRVLRLELEAAGHAVTMVAPATDRSGSSVSITTGGSIAWRQVEPRLFVVEGTPADCVRLALTTLLDERPELVVSGVNFGQNVGVATVSSGTVGAAIAAAGMGMPAIAVSQAVDPENVRNTVRFFPEAAAFAARLVATLAERGGTPLIPKGIVLNLNHPPRARADVVGVKLTRQGRSTLYTLVYQRTDDGEVQLAYAPSTTEESVPDADTTALAAGYVSITPLDGSWSVGEDALSGLRPLVEALEPARPRADAAVPGP
jgi:5'/3'-nucleotidase SurE